MIVLASQSPGRLATLRAAGIEPLVRVSTVDESAVLAALAADHAALEVAPPTPVQQVQALARAKARDVARALSPDPGQGGQAAVPPGAQPDGRATLVVGCDSMLELEGEVIGKPGSAQAAAERWLHMRGRTGVLHTGHTVIRLSDMRSEEAVSSTVVHFGWPTQAEIDAYVATDEPTWCAGAFTIDGLGGAFIDGVEGDPHGVVGLSLPLLRRLVTTLGTRWTDLWNRCPDDPATRP